jgi:hypothetical protein
MAFIPHTKIREGEVVTAAKLNAPYDALDVATVNGDNTKPNWATRYHFNKGTGKFANEILYDEYTGTANFISTSTSYLTVNNAGNLAEINTTKAINDDAILRFGANGIISEPDLNNDGLGIAANRGYNFYAFRILMTYNTGGGPITEVVAECGYSFSGRAVVNLDTGAASDPIWYRNFSFSAIRLVTENNFTLTKVELQAKVCPNGGNNNSIYVQRNNLTVIIAEH